MAESLTYLSDDWLAALADAATRHTASEDVDLVIEYVVCRGHEQTRYWLAFEGRRVEVSTTAPADDRPLVRFTADRHVAAAIAAGERAAQEAFMLGELTIGGDVTDLVDHAGALAELDDVFADVRLRTVYDSADR